MWVKVNEYEKIVAYNSYITKEEARDYINNINTFWIEESIVEQPYVQGKQIAMYLEENKSIRYEYEDVPPVAAKKLTVEEMLSSLQKDTLTNTDLSMSSLEATESVAGDNLLNLDMLVEVAEKVNVIITHLGL